ncbi:MAG TPA: TonB family protein [Casimicrobiaceae bacterium]|nr:TonB family protein [Casimicrobiaceae bacterium]
MPRKSSNADRPADAVAVARPAPARRVKVVAAAPKGPSKAPVKVGGTAPRARAKAPAKQSALPLAAPADDPARELDSQPTPQEVAQPDHVGSDTTPVARTPARKTARLKPAGALPPARIPPEALVAPRNGRLLANAIGISIVLHAIVLAIHFSPIDLRQFIDNGPPLEVALVNARTKAKPTKADILAQANLDGGGNTDQDRRAKTPLPVMPKDSANTNLELAQRRVEALERQTQQLLTQLHARATTTQANRASEADATNSPTADAVVQRNLEAMRLEAQIAREMDAYQKRPKRRFVGARAEEYRFARYVEDWRQRVERIGNENYPEVARRNKLYGKLILTVSIRSDGSVEKVEINRGSGHRLLDAAAKKIVEMGAPYAPFPPDIKRDTDILHITRTWTFAKGDELRSE